MRMLEDILLEEAVEWADYRSNCSARVSSRVVAGPVDGRVRCGLYFSMFVY